MSNAGLQALMLFDNPLMYDDRTVYEHIRHHISQLIQNQANLTSFSDASLALLEDLVLGAIEAVSAARQKAPGHTELELTFRGLTTLLQEIKTAQQSLPAPPAQALPQSSQPNG